MDGRNNVYRKSTGSMITDTDQAKEVDLRNLYPSIIEGYGRVTGKHYLWNGAGTVVKVSTEDAPDFLQRELPPTCCGGTNGRFKYFEEVV
jgi:hypothetical protein